MPILGIIASSFRSAAGPSGAYDSLASVTLSASASSITFAGIPSGYKHLELRMIAQINTGTEALLMQFNGDTGSNYAVHYLNGNGTSATAGASTSRSSLGLFWGMGAPSTASTFGANVTSILDYANTNKYKTIRALDGYDANGSGAVELVSGLWQSTTAITSITLTPNSSKTFNTYSQFALYGVK